MTDIYPLPPPFSDDEILQPLRPRSDTAPDRRRGLWAACGVAAVLAAAGLGAFVLLGDGLPQPERTLARSEAQSAPTAQEKPGELAAGVRDMPVSSPNAAVPAVSPAPHPPAEPAPATPVMAVPAEPPAPPAVQPPKAPAPLPRSEPYRRLASEEIRTHLERGELLLAQGDLAAARLFFERVAEAGDARGAAGLARSHDPEVLSRLPVHAIPGDPAEAERWRRVAASLAPAFAERR